MNNPLTGIVMMRESTEKIPLAVSLACIRSRPRYSIRKAPGEPGRISTLPYPAWPKNLSQL